MPRFAWLALSLFLLPSLAAAESISVEELIQQLGSKSSKMRDNARQRLEKLGPAALPALRKAMEHPELEIRKRAGELVPSIETTELLKPTLITLKTEKKTARQLLEEIGRQAGCKLEMWNDDQRQLHTVDLDKLPFWKAVDEVSKRSGLTPMVGYGDTTLRFQKEAGFPAHVAYHGAFRFVPQSFDYHRTLQFRRIGDDARPQANSETLSLTYWINAEPRLPILSVGEAVVQEAIDSEGRPLREPLIQVNPDPRNGPVVRRSLRYGNGYASTSIQGSMTLGRPSEKARGLKLLRVALPVELLVEQKAQVVCEKIVDVKSKKFKVGTTTFDIESCIQSKDTKQYALKMSVTEANVVEGDYTWINSLYRRVELQDEKGNPYANYGSSWSNSANNHVQATFNYGHNGGKEVGPPAKLLYQMWKTMPYHIQVELRDLPLP